MKATRTGERVVRAGRLRDEGRTGRRAPFGRGLWREASVAGTAGAVLAGAVQTVGRCRLTLRPTEPDPAGAADGKAAPRGDETVAPARRGRRV